MLLSSCSWDHIPFKPVSVACTSFNKTFSLMISPLQAVVLQSYIYPSRGQTKTFHCYHFCFHCCHQLLVPKCSRYTNHQHQNLPGSHSSKNYFIQKIKWELVDMSPGLCSSGNIKPFFPFKSSILFRVPAQN